MSAIQTVDNLDYAFPPKPKPLTDEQKAEYKARIKKLLQDKNAVLVAHYYTDPEIQALAEETGGCVADSLEMARFGRDHDADTLIVAGVRFMGETAKILTPEKTVLMPTLKAECSLDLGCPPDKFAEFCDQYPVSRPHRGGLCQHLSRSESASRLGCHLKHGTRISRTPR